MSYENFAKQFAERQKLRQQYLKALKLAKACEMRRALAHEAKRDVG